MGWLCDMGGCAAIMIARCVMCSKNLCAEHASFYEVRRKLSGREEVTVLLSFCPECADKLERDTLISSHN